MKCSANNIKIAWQGVFLSFSYCFCVLRTNPVFNKIDGKEIVASKPLKEFEKMLEKGFFRSHRSYLVNISRVKRYENESGLLLLEGNKKVPLARQQKSEFMKLFRP